MEPLEHLILRIDPTLPKVWKGASAAQIQAIEKIAGRPLPPFYRWFLERVGKNMGSLAWDGLDFSLDRILTAYDHELEPDGRFLLIGYSKIEEAPTHLFYDLDKPVRNDCGVGSSEFDPIAPQLDYETFREMLAWGRFSVRGIRLMPQSCAGVISVPDGPVQPHVGAVLKKLGFTDVLPSGLFTGFYDHADIAMCLRGSPDLPQSLLSFSLGGPHADKLHPVLDALKKVSGLKIEISKWKPWLRK